MSSLEQFAAETEMFAASLGILRDSPVPFFIGADLDLFGPGPAVLRCGLGIVVDGRKVAYQGPVPRAMLEDLEEQMLQYRNSFC